MEHVLAEYTIGPASRVENLGGCGGLSGAQFFRVHAAAGKFCLRRWPAEHPTETQLRTIHRILLRARAGGLAWLATPIANRSGETFVKSGGSLWQLEPWMPGKPEERRPPDPARLRAAVRGLASFHLQTVEFGPPNPQGPSAGIQQRAEMLQALQNGQLRQLLDAAARCPWEPLRSRAQEYARLFAAAAPQVSALLARSANAVVRLQPSVRDARGEHFLFVANELSGLVDFGALRVDESPATDLARLLGDFAADQEPLWELGLKAYEELRPLEPAERQMVASYDAGNVLLSLANWLRWIAVEQRQFQDTQRVSQILDQWLRRLEALVSRRL